MAASETMHQPSSESAPGASVTKPPLAPTAPVANIAGAQAVASPTSGASNGMTTANVPQGQMPAQCKGFEVLGLRNSPGGATLPNTCAGFDGTLNNPYAIRCVDADPSYKTKYAGDEYCILPPPEGQGIQVHLAPEDLTNPGKFELASGAEVSDYYFVNTSNSEARSYYRSNWRMRPGGHHMLISMLDQDQTDGWATRGDMGSEFGGRGNSFGGAQRPSVDRPQGVLEVPPENAGLGQKLTAHQQLSFNLHHINTTDVPVLREVWINVWYVDDKNVTNPIQTFAATGNPADVAIPARQSARLEYRCPVSTNARIISLYGHYHAHGERFGVAVTRASGEKVSIYESFDWADIPVYQYDSVSTNPTPNVGSRMDGAMSGMLELALGDTLSFECNINNTSDRALRFADEAITGEMCILFGGYIGANPCPNPQRARQ